MTSIRETFKRLRPNWTISASVFVCALMFPVVCQAQDVSLIGRVGSMGLGGYVSVDVQQKVGLRFGVNAFSVSFNGREEDVEYQFDLGLLTGAVLADVYVSQSGFRITGGLIRNGNKLDLDARAQSDLQIGDHTYTDAEVGRLTGRLDFRNLNPFVGIGYDSAHPKASGVGFMVGVGAVLHGSPRVSLKADGPIASDAQFQADLVREEQQIQDDVSFFKVYPALTLGVSYKI